MPNYSGIWSLSQQMQAVGQGLWPRLPDAPTIGTATAGNALCASVTFTAPTCTGNPAGITGYLVTSTPGCKTASGASSPLTVTGLTCGTSYTFKVKAQNAVGYGPCSAASNSVTAKVATCATYTTPGTYSWVAPSGVTSVAVVAVGGGGGGFNCSKGGTGGGGGALVYKNSVTVSPGSSYTVVVGAGGAVQAAGGASSFTAGFGTATANGGGGGVFRCCGAASGGSQAGTYDGGGAGGAGTSMLGYSRYGGGGGAGGYAGAGGAGGSYFAYTSYAGRPPASSSGGGAGGGEQAGGGGVGLFGKGADGVVNTTSYSGLVGYSAGGGGGSSGGNGANGPAGGSNSKGGAYGGGGGAVQFAAGTGASGAVRIVWAGGSRGTPSFPSTNVGA